MCRTYRHSLDASERFAWYNVHCSRASLAGRSSRMAQPTLSEPVVTVISLENEDDSLYEVVNGQRVEKPFTSVSETMIAFVLATYFHVFAKAQKLGRAVPDMIFGLPLPGGLQ